MPSEQLVYPYLTGTAIPGSGFNTTCSVTNGSVTVTGQFSIWETALDRGDVLFVGSTMGLVQEVVSDTELTLATPWAGETAATAPYAAYRNNSYVDPRNYGRRLAEYLTKLRAIPDDIDAFLTELEAIRDEIAADAAQVAADKAAAAASASAAAGSETASAGSATTAGTAATTATGALADFRNIYYGDLPADPATRPDGTPSEDGDFYYNTTTGGLRLRKGGLWVNAVIDANGALVAANNLSDLTDKAVARGNLGLPDSGQLAGFRNLLINATGQVNQRGYLSGAATTAPNRYTLDRWRVVASGQNVSWSTANGVRTFTVPAGGWEQVIEGANILDGTYTLSWTGTATATVNGAAVPNGGQVTLTGGADTTVRFSSGTLSLPQLEPGGTVTPFEMRPIAAEIALCTRYFQTVAASARFPAPYANAVFGVSLNWSRMRAAPSVSLMTAPATSIVSDYQVSNVTPFGGRFFVTSSNAGDCSAAGAIYFLDSELP
jgi:hypothetical protein